MSMVIFFVAAFGMSLVLTRLMMAVARHFDVLDRPTSELKKHHTQAIPLLGGIAIFVTLALLIVAVLSTSEALTFGLMDHRHFIGFLLGGLVLVVGGALDDRFTLPPRITFWFPVGAALVAVIFGIGVSKLSNPFGDPIELSALVSGSFTFVWLLFVIYTTKFLDGLDGLATSVSAIGILFITLLALSSVYWQPDAALFGTICLGALLGFLVWNVYPAKIFLGEGGSTLVGYTLGVLAVIAGSKLGTALLVLSVPLLDVFWVISRRLFFEHRSPAVGDRKHLHHRLLDKGFGQRTIVFWYDVVAAAAGLSALLLQSEQKVIAFVVIAFGMIVLAMVLMRASRSLV